MNLLLLQLIYQELKWKLNNLGFEIERKASDSNQWLTIGTRSGMGTTSNEQNYSFVDNISGLSSEKIYYRLKQIDFSGVFTYSEIIEVENRFAPDVFVLEQNYPNPFNPATKITFGLPEKSDITLKVFNSLGEEVSVIASGLYEAGTYNFNYDASHLTSGIYFYTLQTGKTVISKKMTLVK